MMAGFCRMKSVISLRGCLFGNPGQRFFFCFVPALRDGFERTVPKHVPFPADILFVYGIGYHFAGHFVLLLELEKARLPRFSKPWGGGFRKARKALALPAAN